MKLAKVDIEAKVMGFSKKLFQLSLSFGFPLCLCSLDDWSDQHLTPDQSGHQSTPRAVPQMRAVIQVSIAQGLTI